MHSGKHVRIAGNWNMNMSTSLFLCILLCGATFHCGPMPPHCWSADFTYRLGRSSLDEGSARRRDHLPDNTQHPQETDIHASWRDSNPQPHQMIDYRPCGHRNRLHRVRLFTCSVGHTNSSWIISLAQLQMGCTTIMRPATFNSPCKSGYVVCVVWRMCWRTVLCRMLSLQFREVLVLFYVESWLI